MFLFPKGIILYNSQIQSNTAFDISGELGLNAQVSTAKWRAKWNWTDTYLCTKETAVKSLLLDLLGGAVVKNPPANAGDTGLSPDLGRSHMTQSN